MIVQRRAPWYGQRDRPVDLQKYPEFTELGDVVGDGGFVSPELDMYQKFGYVDDIVRSEHVEFSIHEWQKGVLMSKWIEVITLDWKRALRARSKELTDQQARIRRAGVDLVTVYLPVWRIDRLADLGGLK